MQKILYIIFFPIIKLAQLIEKLVYIFRDSFWYYPELFTSETKHTYYISKLYQTSVPYSHFVLAFLVILLFFVPLFVTGTPKILGYSNNTIIEAVIMGTDSTGEVQKINRVNPLLPSNIQLEKDIVNLIYEPLLRYEYIQGEDGTALGGVEYILAENVLTFKPGADYQFILRNDVFWHDSESIDNPNTDENEIKQFNADDVIRTFEILSQVEDIDSTGSNAYTRALKQLQWEKVDPFTVRVCTRPLQEEVTTCDKAENNPIFSNFLELLSFKIIPEHLSGDITSQTLDTLDPQLYKNPVGTGKYEFDNVTDNSISLTLFNDHYNLSPLVSIEEIKFLYYKSLEDATSAVQNGEAHTLASISTQFQNSFADYKQIDLFESPVLYNQFWALYFNLRKRPDGSSIAPAFLQDVRVRRAISSSINRETIIKNALNSAGEEAIGPIPAISSYFNKNANWHTYNKIDSEALLDEAGWTLKPGKDIRTNDAGEKLSFSLYFVNSFDRQKVAESIRADLAEIGVEAVVNKSEQIAGETGNSEAEGWSLEDLNNQVLSPRLFDVILYGMNTFIDPDRYELYHSTQIDHPGLNIAGYSSSEETVEKRENRQAGESSIIRVPKVDKFLEQARSFDPEKNRIERKQRYDDVQLLIAEDVPAVYLYHPQFLYFANNAVKGINLQGVNSLEERFLHVDEWKL